VGFLYYYTMTIKEQLFEIYYKDNSKNGLYNTLKLVGITQKSEETKRFLAEYNVWRQKKESKIKELREWEKKNQKNKKQ